MIEVSLFSVIGFFLLWCGLLSTLVIFLGVTADVMTDAYFKNKFKNRCKQEVNNESGN